MYKFLAIDLDGTLLDSYGQVTEKNKEAIKKAVQNGVEVVLTSGRGPRSVKNLAEEVGADNYLICGNGAIIYDNKKDEIIFNKFISKNKVLQIIKTCEENSIYYSINTKNSIITKSLNYNVLFYHQENSKKTDDKKTNINIVKDILKYIEERQEEDYLKITICDDNKIIFDRILNVIKNIKDVDVLDVAHMSRKIIKNGTEELLMKYFYTEVTNKDVDKWNAIEFLTQRLGIQRTEIATIGDNVNDKTMIEKAGIGIAMGNSAPYIKEVADYVVTDNDSSGVAQAIETYIL